MAKQETERETQSSAISRQFRQTAGLPERKSDAPSDALAEPPELAPVELEDEGSEKKPAKKTAAKKTAAKKTTAKKA
jgi:hypothetical protein